MLRSSSFIAIALGVAAIASAATPAAALPSQVFGGLTPHIGSQFHPATGVQTSQEAGHVLGQKPVDLPPKIPTQPAKTSVGTAQIPVSQLPVGNSSMKQPQIPVSQLPPPPYKPGPGIDNVCPLNPYKCPPKPPKKDDDDKGHGPVVIVVPPAIPVQVPVQLPVPVQVPVAAPVTAPARVAAASSSAVAAQASTAVAPPAGASQCGTGEGIPPLAAGIDELLPTAQLPDDVRTKVTELRQTIQDMATNGKLAAARNIEEVAMYYLGYQKIWLQCGLGTFAWGPVVNNDAIRSADQSK